MVTMGGRSGKRARPRPPTADEELIPAPTWPPVRPGLSYTLGINPEAIARALLKLEQADAAEHDGDWKE